jgi:large subunit ribosomal protein L15
MKFNELQVQGRKSPKRVGRGIAAGQGKTAGRGTKGQGARTGFSKRPGFEGGQNPLMQRLPKLSGFRSYKTKNEVVFTDQLDAMSGKTIDTTALSERGLITNPHIGVKLLLRGEVTKKVVVKLPGASATAIAAIEKAGGSFEQVSRLARVSAKPKKSE